MIPLVSGSVILSAALLLSIALGHRALKWARLRPERPLEHASLACALGLGLLEAGAFAMTAAGLGGPAPLRVGVTMLALLLVPDLRSVLRSGWRALRDLKRPEGWALILLGVFAIVVLSVFLRVLCPVTEDDSLSYHLAFAERTLRAGHFIYIPTLIYTNWPSGAELLMGLLLGLDHAAAPTIVSFIFGMLTLVLTYLCGRRLGGTFAGAASASVLLLLTRFWREMATAMIDSATAAFAMSALLAYLIAKEGGESRGRWLKCSAVLAGFAATTKLTGAWVIPAMAFVLLLDGPGWRSRLRPVAAYAAFGAGVAAPWYLKTWIITGNPVYPALFGLFGGKEWTPAGWERFHQYHEQFITPQGMQPARALLMEIHWGTAAAFMLLALATIAATRGSAVAPPARFAFLFTAIFCCFSVFQPRYVLAALPPLAVCLGYAASRKERLLIPLVCVASVYLGGMLVIRRLDPPLDVALAYCSGSLSADDYLSRRLEDFPVIQYANRELPPSSRILVATPDMRTSMYRFPTMIADYWRQDSIHFEEIGRMIGDLRRLGVTHLVVEPLYAKLDRNNLADGVRIKKELPPVLELARLRGTKLFEGNGIQLYRLDLRPVLSPGGLR